MSANSITRMIGTLTLGCFFLGASVVLAEDAAAKAKAALTGVPAADLPSRAAKLVKDTKARERQAVTVTVVKAALDINPAAAAPIVGAIARAVPEMAAIAAASAAAQQPAQATLIARAAASADPSRAGKVVAAVCAAVPNQYRSVAVAVSEVAPTFSKDILKSVGASVPALKPHIDREIAGYGMTLPSVATTLDQARIAQSRPTLGMPVSGTPMAPADLQTGGTPSVPSSVTPGNAPPPTSGTTPPGGRNYARP